MIRFLSLLALVLSLSLPAPAVAGPRPYTLDREGSVVSFTWFLGKDAVTGSMPVKRADLLLDFDNAGRSRVDVLMDVGAARAGFPFATTAMKGPKILDAAAHPEIAFHSTRVVGKGTEADVFGDLTIRGVTRPAKFRVQLFKGDAATGSDLTVLMTGVVDRRDFGADGWADMAGSEVRFEVLAHLNAAG